LLSGRTEWNFRDGEDAESQHFSKNGRRLGIPQTSKKILAREFFDEASDSAERRRPVSVSACRLPKSTVTSKQHCGAGLRGVTVCALH
jgi:hypothetical protein